MDAENCLVCLDILYEPHFALPCKHQFCKLCFRQIGNVPLLIFYTLDGVSIIANKSDFLSKKSIEIESRTFWFT